jgi:hypothetical protein
MRIRRRPSAPLSAGDAGEAGESNPASNRMEMRKVAMLIALAAVALVPAPSRAATVLLHVDNGTFFYDSNNDCVGDTNTAAGAVALRHWHVGIPFVGPHAAADPEAAGGFGCLGGPASWTITVAPGRTAAVIGSIDYTWDTNVPGGCCNDVHLHALDAGGNVVASTLLNEGPRPVIPTVMPVRQHLVGFALQPGTYTLLEDVFSGEHTGWLTHLDVIES